MLGQDKTYQIEDLKNSHIPPKVMPKEIWGKQFGREWGAIFTMPDGNTATAYIDKRLQSGAYNTILEVTGTESIAAHIITCDGTEWLVKTEPIAPNHFGITVYTPEGKAIMGGSGEVQQTGGWTANINPLYPNITTGRKYIGGGIEIKWHEGISIKGFITTETPYGHNK